MARVACRFAALLLIGACTKLPTGPAHAPRARAPRARERPARASAPRVDAGRTPSGGAVRAMYSGEIVCAASWDEAARVRFWDALDRVGVDFYFPVASRENPGRLELFAGWQPWLDRLERLHPQSGKPILITKIGYPSVNGAGMHPCAFDRGATVDVAEQADLYWAALEATGGKSWIAGLWWWNWLADGCMPAAGATSRPVPPTLHAGAIEAGIAGSFAAVEGTSRATVQLRSGRFVGCGPALIGIEPELSYTHAGGLDEMEAELGVSLQRRIGTGALYAFAAIGGGVRQEWLGSFRQARHPLGASAGWRELFDARAARRAAVERTTAPVQCAGVSVSSVSFAASMRSHAR